MDDRAIARWRMHTLRLAGRTYPSAVGAVEGMLGVQAENFEHTLWALATRFPGVTSDELRRLVDDGEILRTHVLRPTWHFVRPSDIRWLVEVTAPRVRRSQAQLARTLGMTHADLDAAGEVMATALHRGVHLRREEIAERLTAAGIDASGQRLGLALMHAEASALICSGRTRDRDQTYALLAERAPEARRLSREDALAELALRYFAGHGPATERDLSYWASLTLTDVRTGLRAVAGQLESFDHDGRTYWFSEPPPPDGEVVPRAHLLLSLDEYHNGYQDSRYVLDADGIVPRGRRPNVGIALVDGQMVGGMRRTIAGDAVTFTVDAFRPLAPDEITALEDTAEQYRGFLEVDAVRLVVT